MSTAHLLQQAFILASGVPANAETLAQFESWVEEDGGISRVAAYFDAELGALAAPQGVVATVQQMAFNGLGITLSDAEADAVTQSLIAQGIDSWSELLLFVIETSGGAFDVVDRRADAAEAFNAALESLGGADLFEGDEIEAAVRALLETIDGSAQSLDSAIAQLESLAAEIVDDHNEPEPDIEAPAMPDARDIIVATDGRISSGEATGFSISAPAGTVEGGSRVTITFTEENDPGATVTSTVTASANGSFRLSGIDVSSLADGKLDMSITATDAAGNESEAAVVVVRKDTEAPAGVSTGSVTVAVDGRINAQEQHHFELVAGPNAAPLNASVFISIDDAGHAGTAPVTAQATQGLGGFSLSGLDVSSLADGALAVTFRTQDAAGNFSQASTLTVIKDTASPSGPGISSVTDNVSPAQGAVSHQSFTNDTTPTVRFSLGATGAVPGDTLRLYANESLAAAVTLTTTDVGNGWIDMTPSSLAEGSQTFTGVITDVAGNEGWAGSSHTVVVDTTAPAVSSANISITSTGSGAGGAYAIGDTVTVAFDPAGNDNLAGATVDFTAFGGSAASPATLSAGVYAASYTIAAGDINASVKVSVTATDLAGNATTTQDDADVALDNRAPTVTVSSSAAMLKEGESATITFTFSEDPGASFTSGDVTVSGGTIGDISGTGNVRTATFTAATSANLSTGSTIAVAAASYTDANGNEGSGSQTGIETVFNKVLFVGNSATFGRVDPVMSYNTYDPVTNPGGVHDLTSPSQGGTFTNMTGANLYEPHDWGGVAGLVDGFADQVGLNYDISLSTRNAATLRGHYGNTSPAGWDLRGNIASDSWDIVVLQDQTDEPLPGGSASITFAPGSSTATLVITPTGDTAREYDETLSLALVTGSGYRVASTSSVTTTILNDDPDVTPPNPNLPTVTLATTGSAMEDGANNIVFTFTRTGATTSAMTVTFSLDRDGSTSPSVATSGAGDFDIYSGSPYRFASGGSSTTGTMSFNNLVGTIVIPAGQSSATLTLDPKTDATVENAEGVTLGLKHANVASPLYNLGTQGLVAAAILNDDFASGTDLSLPNVTMSVTSASAVYENSGNALVYTFTRSGDTTNGLTVNLSETGTATYFAAAPGSSDFAVTTTGTTAASLETTSGSNADTAAFEQYATLIENYIHTGAADTVTFPGSPIAANPNANAEADIYLYATWARPDMIVGAHDMLTEKILVTTGPNAGGYEGGTISDSGIQSTGYYLSLEDMSADLTAAYEHLAQVNTDFEGVAPVSTAFMTAVQQGLAIRNPYTETPEEGQVNLWFDDNLHASKFGSYLAGLTLFSTLTGLDARVLGAGDAVAADLEIDAATAVALQGVASATMGFDADLHYTAPGLVQDLGGSNASATLATEGAYSFADGTYTDHDVTVQSAAGNVGTLQAVVRSDGHSGQVNWIYTVNNSLVDPLLSTGQERVDTFTLVLDDGHGHTSVEVIGVTLFGT